jgi:hypothetical protein
VKKTLCFALLLAYLIPFIVFLISTLRLDLNACSPKCGILEVRFRRLGGRLARLPVHLKIIE